MAERCVQTMKASLLKDHRRVGRHELRTPDIQDYTSEPQSTITSRVTEL